MMAFITSGMALFTLFLICQFAIETMFVWEAFTLARRKVQTRNLLLGSFLLALIVVVPMLAAYLVNSSMGPVVYSLLFFPPPFVLFAYYPIFRCIFKAPKGMVLMAMEWVLVSQYVALLVFLLLGSVIAGIMPEPLYWNGVFLPDFPALALIIPVEALMLPVFTRIVNRWKAFYDTPYGYAPENMTLSLLNVFVMSMSTYVMLVCSRLVFWDEVGYKIDFKPSSMLVYALLIPLLLYNLIDRYQKNRRVMIEWQAKQAEAYIQSLLQTTAEFRQLKHDFYNILQTYEGYISMADIDGLSKYHRMLTQTTVEAGANLDMIEALHTRPPIHSLFVIKRNLANQYGVGFRAEDMDALVTVSMNDIDLCRVLGNLLDNAIQAAAESAEKEVRVLTKRKGREVVVEITNSTNGAVDTERFFLDGYTTKEAHPGMGLGSVQRIIRHYSGCALQMRSTQTRVAALLRLRAV